jgi:uncharacterized protein YjgD (DUF1641 family)
MDVNRPSQEMTFKEIQVIIKLIKHLKETQVIIKLIKHLKEIQVILKSYSKSSSKDEIH